jgi:hypothetical protein
MLIEQGKESRASSIYIESKQIDINGLKLIP